MQIVKEVGGMKMRKGCHGTLGVRPFGVRFAGFGDLVIWYLLKRAKMSLGKQKERPVDVEVRGGEKCSLTLGRDEDGDKLSCDSLLIGKRKRCLVKALKVECWKSQPYNEVEATQTKQTLQVYLETTFKTTQ